MQYADFLAAKALRSPAVGLTAIPALSSRLFEFQRDIVAWALRRGRAAIFADCGLGKTLMQLEWARCVPGDALILAPLAVAQQTEREAAKFGIPRVRYVRAQSQVEPGISVTNYEMLEHFDPALFAGIVLDESSILKAYDGKTRNAIIGSFSETPFRLACTATPAPNDFMELGNHSEFLGAMTRSEMLSMFFVHDGGSTQDWRLKGHAEEPFWKWICSWAVMLRKPSDLGYDDSGFDLPPLEIRRGVVASDHTTAAARGLLFNWEAQTLQERRDARRTTIAERAKAVAEMANSSDEQWLVWCNLNAEGDAAAEAIRGAVQIAGSDSLETKTERMIGFVEGRHRVLVSKPSICGFGMNLQNCANVAFLGLSDSYEQFYQAIRRCWRFGQTRPVRCHIVTSDIEGAVIANIQRKQADADKMMEAMVEHMSVINKAEIRALGRTESKYSEETQTGDGWTMHLGDSVEIIKGIPSDSIHCSVFSPPFASLYTYSNSDRDMGNCKTHVEFYEHFRFLVPELLRVTMPGRLLSFHCMNLPTSKSRDGYIGLLDFRGLLIRIFQDAGWIYHSEVVIWKDPVTAMQRTKALGLLHKQLKKDSTMSRQGVPDYLVTMRRPGENPERVSHSAEDFPVSVWQRYASPVWMDINPSNTLQRTSAREEADERHIAPLQLEVIERALKIWTNPGDLVLSPFGGIGSEGYVALREGRRFLGMELKRSYFEQACANLREAQRAAHPLLSAIE